MIMSKYNFDLNRKTLSKIINEHGSVTLDMALRLSRAFKTTLELWLNLQQHYYLWQASHKSDDWKAVAAQKLNTHHVSVTLAPNTIPSQYTYPVGFPDLGSWVNPIWWWIGRKVMNWMFLKQANLLRNRAELPPAGLMIVYDGD